MPRSPLGNPAETLGADERRVPASRLSKPSRPMPVNRHAANTSLRLPTSLEATEAAMLKSAGQYPILMLIRVAE